MSGNKYAPVCLPHLGSIPFDPEALSYSNWGQYLPHTYTNWREETLSWKISCALSANLSVYPDFAFRGPDVIKMLSYASVNNYRNFDIGRAKHIIMCNENGNVVNHGVVRRTGEQEVVGMVDVMYLSYIIEKYNFDVTLHSYENAFLFQLSGPRSLEILEQSTQEDFHDLKFMRFRDATIAGHKVRVLRMGMGGTLSYEITGHGNESGIDIYDTIMQVGKPYGIVKMGGNAYVCNHTENGFPELGLHFAGAHPEDADYLAYLERRHAETEGQQQGLDLMDNMDLVPRGTLSNDIKDYFHNPFELGWGHSVRFDHDFIGRPALEKILEGTPRRIVTLVWNHEDIMKVFASYYEKDAEPYLDMPFPLEMLDAGLTWNKFFHFKVLKDGKQVGAAMWRVYTLYYRETISLACLDAGLAEIGTEVTILYGDAGKRTLEIRAKVDRYPYLDLAANTDYDLDSIPRLERQN